MIETLTIKSDFVIGKIFKSEEFFPIRFRHVRVIERNDVLFLSQFLKHSNYKIDGYCSSNHSETNDEISSIYSLEKSLCSCKTLPTEIIESLIAFVATRNIVREIAFFKQINPCTILRFRVATETKTIPESKLILSRQTICANVGRIIQLLHWGTR